jgi:hydroxyacylglutathione hydrolase
VILLAAGNPSAWTGPTGNNTYLIPGRVPVLVDAGVGNPDHIAAIDRALSGQPLATVLVTHDHIDHAAGAPALAARWPSVAIRQFGKGARPIVDGERIEAGDGFVTVLHTPGHAPDHCCFVAGEDVYCGDLARLGGTIVIPAGRGGDLQQYLDSLRRVQRLRPRRLLPGHGPIVEQPDRLFEEYIRHRATRDAQIADALASGCRTVGEIVSRVYPTLSAGLIVAAGESVTSHLIKLQREGRVAERGGVWTLVDQAG